MYLYAKKYVSKYSNDKKDIAMLKKLNSLTKEVPQSDNLGSIEIKKEVGYWRKANHIHKWFVDNVQEEDDCGYYYVSRDNLIALREECKKVLDNKNNAPKTLPTQDGFFFGGTEYDEYYFMDCEKTIRIIDGCLKTPEGWDFEYNSSW